MIKSGYNCWMFDVSFNHPDDSSFSTSVCYIADEENMPKRYSDYYQRRMEHGSNVVLLNPDEDIEDIWEEVDYDDYRNSYNDYISSYIY